MKNSKGKEIVKCFGLICVGALSGFINGFFGAGGGLLLVPLITFVSKDESRVAHATTLGCVLFMCLSSSVIYFIKKQLDFKFILVCSIGSVLGSLIGTKLLKKLKNNIIDLIFSVILAVAGVFMIIF